MVVDYPGIDYGLGSTNIDDSGIHYGVISANTVGSAIWDILSPVYNPYCPDCGSELPEQFSIELGSGDLPCPICNTLIQDGDQWPEYANDYVSNDPELELSYNPNTNDIWVIKSNYTINAQYCSPCAPGAGNLNSPCPSGPLTYCLPLDLFDDYSPCPYEGMIKDL